MKRQIAKFISAIAAIVYFSSFSLSAATVYWVGGSGDWTNTANWSTGALPGTNDDAVINSTNTPIAETHSSGTFAFNNSIQQTFQFTNSLPMV